MKLISVPSLFAIIVCGCILFGVRECVHNNREDGYINSLATYSGKAQFEKTKNGILIAFNQSLELKSEKQIASLLYEMDTMRQLLKKFSSVSSATIITERTIIQNDTVPFEVQIPCDFSPIRVRRDSIHYVFDGRLTNKSLIIDSIVIPNRQEIVIGTKRVGLFKRERRIEIVNSNPLIKVQTIKNYVIDDRKKWYQKTGVKIAFGAILGGLGVYQLQK